SQAQDCRPPDVERGEKPLPLLHEREGFEGETRVRAVAAAETDRDEHAPARVDDDPLARPHEEEPEREARRDVDEERPGRKIRRQDAGNLECQEIAEGRADDSADGNQKKVLQVRTPYPEIGRSHQPRTGRLVANSIANYRLLSSSLANPRPPC